MKRASLFVALVAFLFAGCTDKQGGDHGHDHAAGGLEPIAYTLYTAQTELFVEFKPLVVGQKSNFAAHFTQLGEVFLPLTQGKVTVSLIMGEDGIRNKADAPSSPGIFRLALVPSQAGQGKLVFDIQTPAYTDQIVVEKVVVYPNEQAAAEAHPHEHGGTDDITYLKEQAWKVDFANAPVQKTAFADIIIATGTILSKPENEKLIVAQKEGILSITYPNLVTGVEVNAGQSVFAIRSTERAESEINTQLNQAQEELRKAKADYERGQELVKDQIMSQKEFAELEKRYKQAIAANANEEVAKRANTQNQTITTPISGYFTTIFVENGQYVQVGTPLAIISKNPRLLLQANVPQKYFPKLHTVTAANFRMAGADQVYDTQKLNGKVISYSTSTGPQSPFLSLSIELDNPGNLVAGSVAEVFLKAQTPMEALIIPESALMEEQGNYYVYVQIEGESFQKREIAIGARDGVHVQVVSGVAEGERVVTKGAYQIKLSTASGKMPAHGHEH